MNAKLKWKVTYVTVARAVSFRTSGVFPFAHFLAKYQLNSRHLMIVTITLCRIPATYAQTLAFLVSTAIEMWKCILHIYGHTQSYLLTVHITFDMYSGQNGNFIKKILRLPR